MYAQSNFKEVFFGVWAKKNIFSQKLLRPFVSVNRIFLKIFNVFGTLKIIKKIEFLTPCSDHYAHAEHTGQELMRTLNVPVRN